MKWSELRKIVEKRAWKLYAHGKKHDIYRHPDKNYPIEIARHDAKEIKTCLYFKLKKQIEF